MTTQLHRFYSKVADRIYNYLQQQSFKQMSTNRICKDLNISVSYCSEATRILQERNLVPKQRLGIKVILKVK
jgi:Mn-dependent DtxR family transcriptional regulator